MNVIDYNEDLKKHRRFYKCTLCNYKCVRKNDYLKHCSTQKHMDMEYFNKYKPCLYKFLNYGGLVLALKKD